MDLARPGLIKNYCQPNAISTFAEFLEDYADENTKAEGQKCIEKSINEIEDPKVKQSTIDSVNAIKNGKRDLFV
jgi:2-iminoacetate synthase